LDWFDCNCGYGVPAKPLGVAMPTAGELAEELEFCGVGEALVYHVGMYGDSAQVGNRLVVEETKGYPALHPTWAVLPPQTGEQGAVDGFLDSMRENGVKALRAYPEEHRFLLNGLTFGSLFEEIIPRRIPLFVRPDWRGITELLADFPELTLVIVGHGSWGEDRFFRPLIERYERLYLDTADHQLAEGLADFVGKYGPDRFLYSSGTPDLQMGAALVTLAGADMPQEAKEAIAGGNLRRLLSEVKL